MIKENQRLLNQLHVLSDGVLVFASMLLAYWLRFCVLSGTASFPFSSYLLLGGAAVALCLSTYAIAGLYASYRAVRFHKEAQTLFLATVLDTLVLISVLFVFKLSEMSRWLLVFFGALTFGSLLCKRALLRLTLRHYRRLGFNRKTPCWWWGMERWPPGMCKRSGRTGTWDFWWTGYVASRKRLKGVEHLGGYDRLEAVLEDRNPDEVVRWPWRRRNTP